jgi:hypothetical protein
MPASKNVIWSLDLTSRTSILGPQPWILIAQYGLNIARGELSC